MRQEVTAIFDIGKTNKKFFLFDENLKVVYSESTTLEEIEDEDGFPCENLQELEKWVKRTFEGILSSVKFRIRVLNFSAYGASLVHLGENGEVLTPLYNYTKSIDGLVVKSFFNKYGPELEICSKTGSPNSGMLNAGVHLYWIKHRKPEIYRKIKYSLHLPQYLSYLFTGVTASENTSIGCHTTLWDYTENGYHRWIYEEGIDSILPDIKPSHELVQVDYQGNIIDVGIGIHDSSAALLPYLMSINDPFILISTGTWSISLNPFSNGHLSQEDLIDGCLNYMTTKGAPVKSSRLFLGQEYSYQVVKMAEYYQVPDDFHLNIKFDNTIYLEIVNSWNLRFEWKFLSNSSSIDNTQDPYQMVEYAYHHLIIELVMLQVNRLNSIIGDKIIGQLIVDGGFSKNKVFISVLSRQLRDYKVLTAKASMGSALGAALVTKNETLNVQHIREHYSLKHHKLQY